MLSPMRASHARRHWLSAAAALLTALVLFSLQQVYYEIQDARSDAREDAESILGYAWLARLQQPQDSDALIQRAIGRFERVAAARYCDASGCLAVGPGAPAKVCSQALSLDALCIQVRSTADPAASIEMRYSLLRSHLDTLRDLAFFAAILLVASAVWLWMSRQLRRKVAMAEADLWRAATQDDLTGLPNRAVFVQAADRLLVAAVPEAPIRPVMLYIELEGLDEVNDHVGHHGGDAVLRETATRFRQAIGADDLLCRLGSKEFAVLLKSPAGPAEQVAHSLIAALSTPLLVHDQVVPIGLNIGAVAVGHLAGPIEEVLRQADVALREAKRAGRNGLHYYSPELDHSARLRYQLRNELKTAIAESQLFLAYQPQVDETGRLMGVEALVRWRHPDRGLVRPDQFIAIAEESGLIVPLGLAVVDMACADLLHCRAQGVKLPYVSVNVSARQLAQADFVACLMAVLDRHSLTARDLELEVTESCLIVADGGEEHAIRQLAAMGFRIAIDDFGTGYSSLSRLNEMPVDKLKIDRSFVSPLPGSGNDGAVAQAILNLAQRLRLKTVAEGVETPQQAEWLRAAGCDLMQGFHFARPMPLDDLIAWTRQAPRARLAAWDHTAPLPVLLPRQDLAPVR